MQSECNKRTEMHGHVTPELRQRAELLVSKFVDDFNAMTTPFGANEDMVAYDAALSSLREASVPSSDTDPTALIAHSVALGTAKTALVAASHRMIAAARVCQWREKFMGAARAFAIVLEEWNSQPGGRSIGTTLTVEIPTPLTMDIDAAIASFETRLESL